MSSSEWIALACSPLVFTVIVVIGRWLKRRAGVAFGLSYYAMAAAVALLLPLEIEHLATGSPSMFNGWRHHLHRALQTAAILAGVVVLLALWRRFFWDGWYRHRYGSDVPKFTRQLVSLVTVASAGLLVATGIYGFELKNIVIGSGILAVILGLALQDTLGNMFAGVALSFDKPYKPGDWLVWDVYHAEVMEVSWRSTRLRTNDDIWLDIPNSQLAKTPLVNLTHPHPQHAMRLQIPVDRHAPPNVVKDALLRATQATGMVLNEPAPKVFLHSFTDAANVYEIKFWFTDHARFNDTQDAIRTNAWYELARCGIRIPQGQRTVKFERRRTDGTVPAGDLAGQLLGQPLFQSLDETARVQLAAAARIQRFGRGERIISQGDDGDSMFILVRGEAQVMVAVDNRVVPVGSLREPEAFGEMSLLTGEKRSATVMARTDCVVAEIPKGALAPLLRTNGRLQHELSDQLARRRLELDACAARQPAADDARRTPELSGRFLDRLRKFYEI